MRIAFLKWVFAAFFLLFFHPFVNSQDRPLGTWKVFMPYRTSVGICNAGDKVYSASGKALFSCEKETNVIQTYDKNTGLSDVDIRTINYNLETKCLVVAYNNSNLDLIYNGTDVYNIPDIKNSVSTGAINIHNISFYQGNAYISSDIGISVINLSKREISNTYIIGNSGEQVRVYSTTTDGISIYAATEEGIKRAPYSSGNLQNFNNWILFDETQNLSKVKSTAVAVAGAKVYAIVAGRGLSADTLCSFDGNVWQKTPLDANDTVVSYNVDGNSFYFTSWDEAGFTGKNCNVDATGNVTQQPSQGHIKPLNWFESNGFFWEGDAWSGLYKRNNQGELENIVPDGPYTSDVVDIAVKDGLVYTASGGADEAWAPIFNGNGVYIYKNSNWNYKNKYTDWALDTFPGMITVEIIPELGRAYVGSFLYGLLELSLNDNSFQIYNKNTNNSTLELTQNTTLDTRISAVTCDQYNNLWIGNAGTQSIKLKKPDGKWKQFRLPFNFDLMKKIVVDQYDQLWAPVKSATNSGVLVWSYEGTLDDSSDDKSRLLRPGEGYGALPDATVYSIAEDREGNMWVGTAQGIAVYYCSGSVLQNGCDADLIKVERDGYIGYLFSTESVRAIAVDAANRKWIGTTNGLWLISSDGKKELLKFNTENSPLPSNQITDIAIAEETGEVFIGTLGGLVSYQGDAIAKCKDCDDALVYPNPVRPGYDGPIAIKGLTDNAYVKITDISGTLVYQGKANGTQMIWDGNGYNGVRVKSGVYLVFSSTDLGKEKRVAKILLTN